MSTQKNCTRANLTLEGWHEGVGWEWKSRGCCLQRQCRQKEEHLQGGR